MEPNERTGTDPKPTLCLYDLRTGAPTPPRSVSLVNVDPMQVQVMTDISAQRGQRCALQFAAADGLVHRVTGQVTQLDVLPKSKSLIHIRFDAAFEV